MAGRFGDGRFTNLSSNAEGRPTEPEMGKTAAAVDRADIIRFGISCKSRSGRVCCARVTAETDAAAELHELHYVFAKHA
jgi:hypothetical protein